MTEQMYRDKVARLTKKKADLEKALAKESDRAARLEAEAGRVRRSINKTTSPSSVQSKRRQIEGKQKVAMASRKKAADIEGKAAGVVSDLAMAQRNLDREAERTRKKQEAGDKRRRGDELRHAREVKREYQAANLYSSALSGEMIRRLPPGIKVLVLAASPVDQQHIRLDEEVREITEKIRAAEHRDSVELASRWAVRTSDLQQHLNELRPHVVHFIGHGSDREELAFHRDDGTTKLVTKEAIAATIATTGDNVRLIVFNACYSRRQAEAAAQYVDVAVGMSDAIGDEAARLFAGQFYSAISFGKSVERAMKQARARIMLEGISDEDVPELFCREGVDPDAVVLVRP